MGVRATLVGIGTGTRVVNARRACRLVKVCSLHGDSLSHSPEGWEQHWRESDATSGIPTAPGVSVEAWCGGGVRGQAL